MKRSVALLGMSLCLSGCLDEGNSWAYVDLDLSNQWQIDSARLEGDLLLTNYSYGVQVHSLSLSLDSASIALLSDAAASFDEANPPDGYSLCHNGHCHNDNGSLVDYEDIIADLETQSGGAPTAIEWAAQSAEPFEPGESSTPMLLESCGECPVQTSGQATALIVTLSNLQVNATIYDLSGSRDMPEGGIDLLINLEESMELEAAIDAQFDRHSPLNWQIEAVFSPGSKLFDNIDWQGEQTAENIVLVEDSLSLGSTIQAQFGELIASAIPGD